MYDPGCSPSGSGSWFFRHSGSRIQASKSHRNPDPDPHTEFLNPPHCHTHSIGLSSFFLLQYMCRTLCLTCYHYLVRVLWKECRISVTSPDPEQVVIFIGCSVVDLWHFGTDPDPRLLPMDPDPDPAIFVLDLQVFQLITFRRLIYIIFLR